MSFYLQKGSDYPHVSFYLQKGSDYSHELLVLVKCEDTAGIGNNSIQTNIFDSIKWLILVSDVLLSGSTVSCCLVYYVALFIMLPCLSCCLVYHVALFILL